MKLWEMSVKINTLLATAAAIVSLHSGDVIAASITDTVVVDDTEWAQISLFTNLSWNDVNAVCPSGVCAGGTLNGYAMSGWTWANVSQANALLNDFIGSDLLGPGPDSIAQVDSVWGPAAFDAGFNPTEALPVGEGTYRGIYAWTSDIATTGCSDCGQNVFIQDLPAGNPTVDRMGSTGSVSFGNSLSTLGALFFRSNVSTVPSPGTFALVLLGIAGLAFRCRPTKSPSHR